MSGDTPSSDMTWAHAACSVDKLDKTADDGAVNDRAAHGATADAKAAAEDSMDALFALPALGAQPALGAECARRPLVDRTRSVAAAFRSPLLKTALLKNRAALGGAGARRTPHCYAGSTSRFERVVRSSECCSLYGGSTPR
jgi:hypothetical protein